MKILITGGAGFIGSRLARTLLEKGHTLTILENFNPQIHGSDSNLPADLSAQVQLIRGDVRDLSMWKSILPTHQCVVHLAAETGTGQSMYEVARYEQVNLAGTANLYQVLAAHSGLHVERIVVASSRAVYGEGAYQCPVHSTVYPRPQTTERKRAGHFDPVCPFCGRSCVPIPTAESAPFQPSSFYGLTKQGQEQMALMFGGVLGIPSIALRYQNVYGPGQSLSNPYTGILAIFSNLARAGAGIDVFEDGKESRDFVYIDDAVRATAEAATGDLQGWHAINVGSGESTSVLDVATQVNHFYGDKSRISISGAFRDGDIRHGIADLTRAHQLLRYEPQTRFQDGLRKFLDWAGQSSPEPTAYKRSLTEMRDRGLLHG
jgi:dTDP-L-rhamnose 4-epimerase